MRGIVSIVVLGITLALTFNVGILFSVENSVAKVILGGIILLVGFLLSMKIASKGEPDGTFQ